MNISTRRKLFLITSFLLSVLFVVRAQEFSISFESEELPLSRNQLIIDSSMDEEIIITLDQSRTFLEFYQLNLNQTSNKGIRIFPTESYVKFKPVSWKLNKFDAYNNYITGILNTENTNPIFLNVNRNTSETWGRLLSSRSLSYDATLIPDLGMHLCTFTGSRTFEMHCFDSLGNTVWNKGTQLKVGDTEIQTIRLSKVIQSNNNIFCLVSIVSSENNIWYSGILKFDLSGNILNDFFLKGIQALDLSRDENGTLYIVGGEILETGLLETARLYALDEKFSLLWIKKLSAENFVFADLNIEVTENNIFGTFTTPGTFPTILASFDKQGNIVTQKGFSPILPSIHINSKGQFYINSSHELQGDGSSITKQCLIGLESLSDIEICPTFDSCLQIENTTAQQVETSYTDVEIEELSTFTFEVSTSEIELEEYCNELQEPTPHFLLPEELCINDCIHATGLNNILVNDVKWEIEFDSDSLIIIEEKNPEFCFEKEGIYKITNKIWYLGCEYSFERELHVQSLPNLNYVIENSCLMEDPTLIIVDDDFNYLWEDGSETDTFEIMQSGNYTLLYSNDVCDDSITFEIDRNIIDQEELMSFPTNDTLCSFSLPFKLIPRSNFDNLFFTESDSVPSSELSFNTFGTYLIQSNFNNCNYQQRFNLIEKDCTESIYIPNSFSPNGDGINDNFQVYTYNSNLLSLKIYNRWGAKIFETTTNTNTWDGKHKNKVLAPDVFYYALEYINIHTLEIKLKTGSINLFR